MAAPNAPRHTTSEIIGLYGEGVRSGTHAGESRFASDDSDVRGIDASLLAQLADGEGGGDVSTASTFALREGGEAVSGTDSAVATGRRSSRRESATASASGPALGDGGGGGAGGGVPWTSVRQFSAPSASPLLRGGDAGASALISVLRAEVRRLHDRVIAAEAEAAALRRVGVCASAPVVAVGTPIGVCPTCGTRQRRKRGRSRTT